MARDIRRSNNRPSRSLASRLNTRRNSSGSPSVAPMEQNPAPCCRNPALEWAQKLLASLPNDVAPEERALLTYQVEELNRIPQPMAPLPRNPTMVTIVRDRHTLSTLARDVQGAKDVVICLAPTATTHYERTIGIGLALEDSTFYVPSEHFFDSNRGLRPNQIPFVDVLRELSLQSKKLICHDAKCVAHWLLHHGIEKFTFAWDTMIAAKLLRFDLPADLKTLAELELDVPEWQLSRDELRQIRYVPIDTIANYCAKACWYTRTLYKRHSECRD